MGCGLGPMQETEIAIHVLNRMLAFGRPHSIRIA
jgi:hypothetical protein